MTNRQLRFSQVTAPNCIFFFNLSKLIIFNGVEFYFKHQSNGAREEVHLLEDLKENDQTR